MSAQSDHALSAHREYAKVLAERLGKLSLAMCRKRGIEIGRWSTRMKREDNDAIHDLYDAVQNKPGAAEFLDWLLELAENDLQTALLSSPAGPERAG